MGVFFSDRADAGRQLAAKLRTLTGTENLLVLGLPRGGIPVAREVARVLGAQMEVFVVRKLGVPDQEELAMGAVAPGGIRVLDADVIGALGIRADLIEAVSAMELRELQRREAVYRQGRPLPDLNGATVVLVDDGVATGSTMLAAIRALREQHPAAVVAAAPVMSALARARLAREANACVTLAIPDPFIGVGASYLAFPQLTDAEVLDLLAPAQATADSVHLPAGPTGGVPPGRPAGGPFRF